MDFIGRIDNNSMLDQTAYRIRDDSLTYRELKWRSDALAVYLLETLGKKRKPVIVYGHKNSWMPVCFLACAKSG
ncbi:MAG: AMP-binding protein, partial [Eubacteriales bacterium]